MIPSVLAGQLKQGVEDFLRTTFPITNPFFHNMLDQFLANKENLFKGPYLSLNLPFHVSKDKKNIFPHIPMPHDPYRHQEKAFARLSGQSPQSTIIATGTGSGKTECFLYPILDHIFQHRGERGIKAILIYPMNALASDQAQRLAKLIYNNPDLRGYVTAALYIGQKTDQPQPMMSKEKLVTAKDIIRQNPPDILLTNYKMLDYLLIRPEDRDLWNDNTPETLKYLVVDELHTFDGAQGTDLACLIRRLKSRLNVPENHLCCIGTSATIGSENQDTQLREYARTLFAEPFDHHAVINEERLTVGQFLEESYIRYTHTIDPARHHALKPGSYDTETGYILAQYNLWFDETPAKDTNINTPQWRSQLAERLKSHQVFQNLLRVLQGRVLSIPDIIDELKRVSGFPTGAPALYYEDLFNGLLALVSTARSPVGGVDAENNNGTQPPFPDVRVQFWMRELRRMVSEVKPDPQLRFFDDLKEAHTPKHLPVIHCRDCGSTGWGGVFNRGDSTIQTGLKSFYIHFFSQHPNLCFLFPAPGDSPEPPFPGAIKYLCTQCLNLGTHPEKCPSCGSHDRVRVQEPEITRHRKDRNVSNTDCPFCRSPQGLSILGSRAASLTSIFIGQLAGSTYNRDRKLVTFSDSVQDAAHRAGFFGARTYSVNFRSALAQVVREKGEGKNLEELPRLFTRHWQEKLDKNTYITTFIGPNMEWLADYDHLCSHGSLPPGTDLPELVNNRIGWNIYSEYGYRARIGRTLERSSVSVLQPNPGRLETLTQNTLEILRNEIGVLRDLQPGKLKQFISGMLMHLKLRGGIFFPALDNYIKQHGNTFHLNKIPYMPSFAPHSPAPRFLTNRPAGRFESLAAGGTSLKTWHEHWLYKNFEDVPLILSTAETIFNILLKNMTETGILEQRTVTRHSVWGLRPGALSVTNHVVQYTCETCRHNVSTGREESPLWEQMPCLRLSCNGRYTRTGPRTETDYYGKLYQTAAIHRIVAREHTGLLTRDEREKLEKSFKENIHPWDPNLLSATPTIEMGIDIGDLSTVILCSIPPTTANYLQRIGRSGRKNGNALNIAVATGKPHDLYFFAEPEEMIAGHILPPGIYLEASAILERQFVAFCMDRWIRTGIAPHQFPGHVAQLLNHVDSQKDNIFPYTFLQFIKNRKTRLLDSFIQLFNDVLSDEKTADRLRRFAEGRDQEAGLEYRILNTINLLSKERKSYKDQAEKLKRKIRKKEQDPVKDLNYETEIEEMRRERTALLELIKTINKKRTLNFFTDEGLIPNYTFPEAGVLLKSVVYRKKKPGVSEKPTDSGNAGPYQQWVYEYERPARSAINELAPANSFYAGGRKVTVQRVDLSLSSIEEWRFCPTCPYCERVDLGMPEKKHCPRCGNMMWGDAGQKHRMLLLRQVFANTRDRDSRIHDDKEDRSPLFYNTQMLVDIDPVHIRGAYKLSDETFPFGFEFLEKAGFLEINSGQLGEEGEHTAIAGIDIPRKGFTLCKHCGQVQTDEGRHAIGCPANEKKDDNAFQKCLYLYRRFHSEAIRILLPATRLTGADKKRFSFVAALQLGLRRKFGGAVDHLQTTVYSEPIPDSPQSREYLVLYDQVPGGTGYLKQLMRSQRPLLEVFQLALDVLENCRCGIDPTKDGCYRCLLAYRHSLDMQLTSRTTAMEMLIRILSGKESLTPTEHLGTIDVNAHFESELEARFIETIRQFKHQGVDLTVTNEIVNRKTGYRLKINNNTYLIEPQATLDPSSGVSIPSKADFVFWPQRPVDDTKPIAVFTDGFIYHKDRVHRDTAQRMALVQSDRFLNWSLTWKDVDNEFNPQNNYYDTFLNLGQNTETLEHYNHIVKTVTGGKLIRAYKQTSFQLLMTYLAEPDADAWSRYAFAQVALWIRNERISGEENIQNYERTLNTAATEEMVEFFHQLDEPKLLCRFSRGEENSTPRFQFLAAVTRNAVNAKDVNQCFVTAYLDDSDEKVGENGFQNPWNSFLRLYNLAQFLPLAFFTTRKGIENDSYDALTPDLARTALPLSPVPESDRQWREIRELTDPRIHPLLDELSSAAASRPLPLPLPEPGYELQEESGAITAEAELAWPDQSIALLLDTRDFKEIFENAGWQVFSLDRLDAGIDPLIDRLTHPAGDNTTRRQHHVQNND